MFKHINTNKQIADLIAEQNIEFIDVRFLDVLGIEQHFAIPANQFAEGVKSGLAFDGSSIRGFQSIEQSDMKLIPDPTTAYIDPFLTEHKTLNLTYNVVDPITDEPYSRDTRQVAQKAEDYMRSTGIADTAYFAPEAEFYIFDDIRFSTSNEKAFFSIDSIEGAWNTGAREVGGNLGHKPSFKGGYFPVPPVDHFTDLRNDITHKLGEVGLEMERAHHEVGTAGQQEINYKYNSLKKAGDDLVKFKYIVKNMVNLAGKTATFLPKPIFGDNGSGMHCHQSLWKNGKPLFYKKGNYADLSDIARWYIGGIIKHSSSLIAFTNPSVNSFKRLVPGFEAPINMVYSNRNRSAAIRIPLSGDNANAKRIEFRCPDPCSNPYLSFSAQLMAGLDGIENKIEPPAPLEKDIYSLPKKELSKIKKVPRTLDCALAELEKDNEYLLKGDVFTPELINFWIDHKYEEEILPLSMRPHPFEFELYYNI